jgi:hypothetical protein
MFVHAIQKLKPEDDDTPGDDVYRVFYTLVKPDDKKPETLITDTTYITTLPAEVKNWAALSTMKSPFEAAKLAPRSEEEEDELANEYEDLEVDAEWPAASE